MCHSLGKSGLKISKIILGTMGFGSKDWQDWVLDEEESLNVIEHAYKRGINTWDTVSRYPTRSFTKPSLPRNLAHV
jgi:aryl-alcohol dehydrogenase-like predicted oxidoreductase